MCEINCCEFLHLQEIFELSVVNVHRNDLADGTVECETNWTNLHLISFGCSPGRDKDELNTWKAALYCTLWLQPPGIFRLSPCWASLIGAVVCCTCYHTQQGRHDILTHPGVHIYITEVEFKSQEENTEIFRGFFFFLLSDFQQYPRRPTFMKGSEGFLHFYIFEAKTLFSTYMSQLLWIQKSNNAAHLNHKTGTC